MKYYIDNDNLLIFSKRGNFFINIDKELIDKIRDLSKEEQEKKLMEILALKYLKKGNEND